MPDGSALSQSDFDAQLVEDISGFAGDPEAFALYAFPWGEKGTPLEDAKGPHDWHIELFRDIRDGLITVERAIQIATASGHGIGKSAFVAMIICWAMATMAHTRGVVTAGTDTQLKTKTQPEISKWFKMMICSHWFELTATKIYAKDHPNSWRIDFIPWSETNPEAFAGLHNKGRRILIVIDEASQVADIIWETLRGALTDEDTEILFLVFGNPTRNTGEFRQCFGSNRHRWINRQIDSRTVPGTNKALIAEWAEDWGEDSDYFRVRVRGQFPSAGDLQFIPTADVEACIARELPDRMDWDAPVILGVDVARFGDDKTVIYPRVGRDARTFEVKKYRKLSTMDTVHRVIECAGEFAKMGHEVDAIIVDGVGVGGGVVDRLRELGYTVHEVNGGAKASDDRKYINKNAEMWSAMKAKLSAGMNLPDDNELTADLTGREYGFNDKHQLRLEKKDDMKKRGLASPDIADALALTFAVPIHPKYRAESGQRQTAPADYDPFD